MSPKDTHDQDWVVWQIRNDFLSEIEKRFPTVLEDLEEKVLPIFERIVGKEAKLEDAKALLESASGEPLQKALREWSAQFNLDANWMRDVALETIHTWLSYSQYPKRSFAFFTIPWSELSEEEMRFEFVHPGWDPTMVTWQEALNDEEDPYHLGIRPAFEKHLKEYRKRMETLVVNRGYHRVRHVKKKSHIPWLVYYQLTPSASFSAVVKHFTHPKDPVRRENVENAVKDTAKLIGLKLKPPSKGGRPRKKL